MDTLLNPVVIFEVLSESTERYDRGEKFAHYRRLPCSGRLPRPGRLRRRTLTGPEDGRPLPVRPQRLGGLDAERPAGGA